VINFASWRQQIHGGPRHERGPRGQRRDQKGEKGVMGSARAASLDWRALSRNYPAGGKRGNVEGITEKPMQARGLSVRNGIRILQKRLLRKNSCKKKSQASVPWTGRMTGTRPMWQNAGRLRKMEWKRGDDREATCLFVANCGADGEKNGRSRGQDNKRAKELSNRGKSHVERNHSGGGFAKGRQESLVRSLERKSRSLRRIKNNKGGRAFCRI